jgi:hypothetical protein
MTTTAQNLISAFILRLRLKSPFFATLAMFARFLPTTDVPATEGSIGKNSI